jgi:uncharacterized peroxidase-related enzyme
MTLRLEYWSVAPQAIAALTSVNTLLERSAVGAVLINLMYLRVSQINGCAYCMDLHASDLRKAGETDARIDDLADWHDSALFSDREKAALTWAEAVTRIEGTPPPDAAWAPLREHFDDKEVADITYAAALMNAWNRIAIAFSHEP